MQPRVIRMMWDFDAASTDAMMKDMGVSLLKHDEQITDRAVTATSGHTAAKSFQFHVSELMNSKVSVVEHNIMFIIYMSEFKI